MCAGNLKKSHDDFVKELNNENPNIEVLGRYINCDTRIKVRCKIDGHEWSPLARKRIGCPICNNRNKTKTHEQFVDELSLINKDIVVVGKYTNNKTKIKVMCLNDGHIWKATPAHLLNGTGCPICRSSKGEKEIIRVLEKFDIKYTREFSPYWANNRRYDFLIFESVLIEYDGIQHFEEVNETWNLKTTLSQRIEIDLIKNSMAKENGFKLLRISYSEIDNIENIIHDLISSNEEYFHKCDLKSIGKEYVNFYKTY